MGLRDTKIQQALLQEDSWTFEQCCRRAGNMESTKSAAQCTRINPTSEINAFYILSPGM